MKRAVNLNSSINPSKPTKQHTNAVLFTNVNLHQVHLTPSDLKGYETIYPGAAKEVMQLIGKTVEAQHTNDLAVHKINAEIIKNERLSLYLSFFLAMLALAVGCYLIAHPSAPTQILGVILLLSVCLSAFDIKILSWLTKVFKEKCN